MKSTPTQNPGLPVTLLCAIIAPGQLSSAHADSVLRVANPIEVTADAAVAIVVPACIGKTRFALTLSGNKYFMSEVKY